MDQLFIDLYNMRTAEGLSRVPAAKSALGLDADRTPSLRENDDIQALIEAAEAQGVKEEPVQPRRFPVEKHSINEYRRRRAAGDSIQRAARAALGYHPTNELSDHLHQVIDDLVNAVEFDKDEHDPVNHPSHYTQYKDIEVITLTEQMNFNLGNAVKYIARAGFKDPDKEIEDLEKARWYLNREIERKKSA